MTVTKAKIKHRPSKSIHYIDHFNRLVEAERCSFLGINMIPLSLLFFYWQFPALVKKLQDTWKRKIMTHYQKEKYSIKSDSEVAQMLELFNRLESSYTKYV